MAGALVGGALLSAFLQVVFDRLASRQVVDFFSARKLDEGLLSKLKVKLRSIDALADDAELKQLTEPRVRQWLFDVKDAVFDAEDLLAEINYKITKCQVEAQSESQTFTRKVSSLFKDPFGSFNKKIVSDMKQVLDKLECLASQKGDLGLKEATYPGVGSGSKVSQKLESSSLVAESVIYGRDDDKKVIFNWLTSETNNQVQLSTLSVVGMGGSGKTTLAQDIYKDPRMEDAKFDIKAWVCISDDFDVLTVTKAILEAVTKSRDDSGSLNIVRGRLKEELSRKRFLLVLDDVWNLNRKDWEAVQTPLNYGASGSKILVTTRLESVASTMGSNEVHHIKQLQEDQCWKVFAEHAFPDDHLQLNVELKEIAAEIVKKCKGLPLALKSIGSLLHTKSSIFEWKNVLLSNIWDLPKEGSEIIPALYLSYHHLPSHLKRCFAFCALLPKDCEFKKKNLISLWTAENLLQCRQLSNSPEEVGELYFDDLLSRSFFQQSSRPEKSFFQQSSRSEKYFVMHDLFHDLAKYVCGEICFRLGDDEAEGIPKTTRHFSFNIYHANHSDDIGSLSNAKRLRTFIPTSKCMNYDMSWRGVISIHELCSKFKFLHNLSLSHCSNLIVVPESIGELKYLCSLNLSKTDIKRLPDSTCSLYNLQILKLNSCWHLEELPSNLNKLTNLRCLEFRDSKVRKMPVLLEKLKNLQVLSTFCVGKSSELSIQQLRGLNLHGELSIEELQNTVNPMDALAVDLKNKTHLVKLALVWNSNHKPDDPRKDREVFECLQPSKYLKDLSICNYGGTQFPSWLSDYSYSNVVSLWLENCKYCILLPPFGLLPFLKELTITGLDGIVSIGAEFYGTSSSPFPSLEKLYLENMKEWEEWECKVSFPLLQSLNIWRCPKLKEVSEQLFHIKKLGISSCESIKVSWFEKNGHAVSNTSLEDLYISGCPNMNIPNRCCYDSLVTLGIVGSCDSQTTFSLDLFPKLSWLELKDCRNLRMITQEHTHNHLKELDIWSCPQFESFHNEGLFAQVIHDCPQVEMFVEGGLPSTQEWFNIGRWQGLIRIELMDSKICELPQSLHCPKLKVLLLQGNVDLMDIPDSFFNHVPLLQYLDLSSTSIRDLPPSLWKLIQLEKFYLRGCDLFMELPPQIGQLKNLEELNLDRTLITHLPGEIQELTNLQSLTLCFDGDHHVLGHGKKGKQISNSTIIPRGVISNLSELKYLNIKVDPEDERWNENVNWVFMEILGLKRLETVSIFVPKADLLKLMPVHKSLNFRLVVGHHMRRFISRVTDEVEQRFKHCDYSLKFVNGENVPNVVKMNLGNFKALYLDRHMAIKSLSDFDLRNLSGLQICIIAECNEMESIVNRGYVSDGHALPNLEFLSVFYMKNLRSICERPKASFLHLKSIALHTCPMLTTVFTLDSLNNLSFLEEIIIEDCPKVTTLVSLGSPKQPKQTTQFSLPRLRRILLLHLPELVNIFNGLHVEHDLEQMVFYCCPKLRSLSKSELSSKSLRIIKGESMWWKALKWNAAEWGNYGGPNFFELFSPINEEVDLMNQLAAHQEYTHNHLKHLDIWGCPQSESFPNEEGLSAPCLESFHISAFENLESLPKRMHILLPSLTYLAICDCPKVEMFSEGGLPSNLKWVRLSSFKIIGSLKGALGANTCLRILSLNKVDVECIPEEGLLPLSLTSLRIEHCPNLKKLDYKGLCNLSSLKELILSDCPNLQCLPEEGLPKSISSLTIRRCPSLKGALGANTRLDSLYIENADMECFPEDGLLPLSLTSLLIGDCPNLKKLNYKGLCNLYSLESLSLRYCPNLQCLPEEGLPKSISSLTIGICPLLKKRCQQPEGEDWGKIAHIPRLRIW